MRPRRAWMIAAAALVAAAVTSSPAVAESGSVTNITPTADGYVTATFTATAVACPIGVPCFMELQVFQRYADGACVPLNQVTPAGVSFPAGGGDTSFTATFRQHGYNTPRKDPVRICLVLVRDHNPSWLGDGVYTPNWQTAVAPPPALPGPAVIPTPPTTPAVGSARPPVVISPDAAPAAPLPALTLSKADAVYHARRRLRARYAAFRRAANPRLVCHRLSRVRLTCRATWRRQRVGYTATATVSSRAGDLPVAVTTRLGRRRLGA